MKHRHLGADEEVALRRVALGYSQRVAAGHIPRLKALHLIEADKGCWRLTALGQKRFKALPRAAKLASDGTPHEIAAVLFAKLREERSADQRSAGATDAAEAE